MLIKGNQCPICDAPWQPGSARCKACGSIAEIYFESPLPKADSVDEERIQQTIDRVRAKLTAHENDGIARYILALCYLNLGFLPEAAAELQKATQLLPEKTVIAYEAAAVAAKQDDFSDDVLRKIDRALERRPDFKEAIYLKGLVLQKRGEVSEGVRVWQTAYKLDPDYLLPRQALKRYVTANYDLLRKPRVVHALRSSQLAKKERNYLDLINWTGMDKPRELGTTSMQLLESIAPARAKALRRMHAARKRQYEEVQQKRVQLEAAMQEDLIALSELCILAWKAESQTKAAARSAGTRMRRLSLEERSAILDQVVRQYQKRGYRLVSKTETTAQLSRQHQFSCCLALILVVLVIGIILYLIYYLTAKKEYYVFIEVDEYGQVHTSHS